MTPDDMNDVSLQGLANRLEVKLKLAYSEGRFAEHEALSDRWRAILRLIQDRRRDRRKAELARERPRIAEQSDLFRGDT